MARILFAPRALGSLLGAVLLALLLWWFSPLLGAWLDDPLPRGALALLPLLVWLGLCLWLARRRATRDSALVEAATEPSAEASRQAAEIAGQQAAQREKLAAALAALRRSAGARGGYLYQLPWYVLIGPPGAGKTTALLHSGLEFPLAEGKVPGIGGTRQCDWWLSDSAVLIDTAGRYTTQDSDAAMDRAEWEGFLGLLRRARPRLPLNGILVAIGTDMLGALDEAGRDAHARAIRRRVRETEERLGQRLPVYLLLTKADLLLGFNETFDGLDGAARAQVWGVTFAPEEGLRPEGAAAAFPAAFTALRERLSARLVERLQAERGTAQRALIAGFPAQVAALELPLTAFLRVAFGGSRLDPAPFLRGVYLTSGTQEGTPLDRLAGALSRGFGLDPQRPAAVMGRRGRAYFLGRLLKEVVFGEARLAAREGAALRRARWLQAGAWTTAALLLLGGGAYAWQASQAEAARAARVEAALAQAEAAARAVAPALDPVRSPDLSAMLAYLEAAGALPVAAAGDIPGFGLSQAETLEAGTAAAYRRVLGGVLLPRLLARLEQQIREGMQRPETLYEATRLYLMLGRQGPLDADLVRAWMARDWAELYPGAVNQPGREALLRHLDALLALDLPAYPLDGALVDEARRVFSRRPMAERVYARLRPLAREVPPWRPADILGEAGQRHFRRASGQPLTEGIPGLYTVEGLHRAVLPGLPRAVLEAAAEAWVLGPGAALGGDPRRLEAEVLALYAADYAAAWQALLADLSLPPPIGLAEAAAKLNLLGAPNSPLRDLLRGIARQLAPGTPPEPPAGTAAPAAAAAAAGRVASALDSAAGQPAETVGRLVESRFRPLREAAGAPLDGVLAILNELYVQVARLAAAPPGTVLPPAPGLDPGQRLLAEAARQPPPLDGWLRALAQSTQQARAGGARAAIAAAGAQQLAPFCRGLESRFPFRRVAGVADMPVDDFVRLFAPGGLLDQFFQQQIRPHADTTQRPWRPVAADGLEPAVSAADLLQFQRAQAIRDAFFPSGVPGLGLGLRWQLLPQGLGGRAEAATLEVEGVKNALPATGGGRPVEMAWPARAPAALGLEGGGAAAGQQEEGPWSTLRLVMLGRLSPTAAPDRFRLSLGAGGATAEFVLQATSGLNPFGLRELGEFRCPALAR